MDRRRLLFRLAGASWLAIAALLTLAQSSFPMVLLSLFWAYLVGVRQAKLAAVIGGLWLVFVGLFGGFMTLIDTGDVAAVIFALPVVAGVLNLMAGEHAAPDAKLAAGLSVGPTWTCGGCGDQVPDAWSKCLRCGSRRGDVSPVDAGNP
jgi:hypothetical protein